MRHHPTYDQQGRTQWFWICSCGDQSPTSFLYREHAHLNFLRHEFSSVAHREPDHAPTFTVDPLGVGYWTCSCGRESRARGHNSDQRLRQSHTRHVRRALVTWYERQRVLAERRTAEATAYRTRMDRLSPEGQERLMERDLEEIL